MTICSERKPIKYKTGNVFIPDFCYYFEPFYITALITKEVKHF